MKKEQSIINKDDFFAGKLTDEQEKQLINNENDSFFETLKEEKEVKMDFFYGKFRELLRLFYLLLDYFSS